MSSKFEKVLIRKIAFFLLLLSGGLNSASAQIIPALSFEIKKPQKLENKKLGSEKTGEKKFTAPRRFMQNTVTKFNWHFNANEKLKEILARAKDGHKDDYNQLLSFYNYSLSQTARDSVELDSVIYKANAGILLHDLRNSWVDNMYMLMGKAYYFRQTLDTAYLTFQYINYAFSPKEKDGYDKPIGSNANEGGNAFSIATKEPAGFSKKVLSRPPSRNESFLWLIRTYISNGEYPEAAGLIETLKHDPNFPERLDAHLAEMQSFWFYEQQLYDSAAFYLERALPQAENREETARWEFLIGQLYEASRKNDKAAEFYSRAVKHTLNPILEVYARLYAIRQNNTDDKAIDQNILDLLKMVKRDKYTNYRDIIYYSIARMELERNNREAAKQVLILSTKAAQESSADKQQKSRSFFLLGELQYADGKYLLAKSAYDSVADDDVVTNKDLFQQRLQVLGRIAEQDGIIERQDSLQRIASLPEAEREAYLRKMVRRLRKLQGLKEEDPVVAVNPTNPNSNTPPELFDNNAKGDWYFYNNSLKSKGFTEFKGRWGNRPNVDNWRRITAVNQALQQQQKDKDVIADKARQTADTENDGVISYENLLKRLPLTPEQLAVSNDSIADAKLAMAKALMEGLEDYPATIRIVTELLERFPYFDKKEEALFYLYYSYLKTGQKANAEAVKRDIEKYFKGSEFEKKINTPAGANGKPAAEADMTKRYERIYTLFIEGQFPKALAEKKIADSLYGSNYWTPQLLYIQSVYFIKEKKDDTAKVVLQDILNLYPNTTLAEKAKNLMEVLGRRKEIEQYLTDLKIERPKEDSIVPVIETKPAPVVRKEPAAHPAKDSTAKPPVVTPPPVVKTNPVVKKDSVVNKPTPPPAPVSKYAANPAAPHYVMIVLTKVDGVFVSEARNAFNRYNKQTFYNKPIEATNEIVNDTVRIVLLNNFTGADDALSYVEKVRKIAATEIVPWLPAGKYSFTIISQPNLEVFRNEKNTAEYLKFLKEIHPGKFE